MGKTLENLMNKRHLRAERIQKIINSYQTCNGNAARASRGLWCSYATVLKHWKSEGLKIKGIKGKSGPRDKSQYNLVQELIASGCSRSEISRELGISRQAVQRYTNYHNLECIDGRRKKGDERYNLIKRLIEEGDLFEEIAEFSGISSFHVYLYKHPTLPKPKRRSEFERERKIELIKKGLLKGLPLKAIAEKEGIPPRTVYYYTNDYPQLRKIYDKI